MDIIIMLAAIAAFGYAVYRFHESRKGPTQGGDGSAEPRDRGGEKRPH